MILHDPSSLLPHPFRTLSLDSPDNQDALQACGVCDLAHARLTALVKDPTAHGELMEMVLNSIGSLAEGRAFHDKPLKDTKLCQDVVQILSRSQEARVTGAAMYAFYNLKPSNLQYANRAKVLDLCLKALKASMGDDAISGYDRLQVSE